MKTKLNIVEEPQTPKLQETHVRDSRQLKVKTGIRCGFTLVAVKTT
jgi:hypothetical protein